MPEVQLAQLNIARLAAPIDSPQLADFVANLERINALAESSAGFVWRLQTEEGDATAIRHFGDDVVVNMSVWEDVESLRSYVYETAHVEILRRRREWFEKSLESHLVLWWVPEGHIPTLHEAEQRLHSLQRQGPGPEAFTFREAFPPPSDF
jgi:hypothetical protein